MSLQRGWRVCKAVGGSVMKLLATKLALVLKVSGSIYHGSGSCIPYNGTTDVLTSEKVSTNM